MSPSAASTGAGVVYRFLVDQSVKGPVGREVEVTSRRPLVDAADKPLVLDEALGVMALLDGARLTTESCLLTDPGALLSVSDEVAGELDQGRDRARDPRRRARVLDPPAAGAPAAARGAQ